MQDNNVKINFNLEYRKILNGEGNYKSSKEAIFKIIKFMLQYSLDNDPMEKDDLIRKEVFNGIYYVIKFTNNSILDEKTISYLTNLLISILHEINKFKYLKICKNENIVLEKFLKKLKEKKLDKSYIIEEFEKINKIFIPKSTLSKIDLLNLKIDNFNSLSKSFSIHEKTCYMVNKFIKKIDQLNSYFDNEYPEKIFNDLYNILSDILIYYTWPILLESEKTQIFRFFINNELKKL